MKHLWVIAFLLLVGPLTRADQIIDVKAATNYELCSAEDRVCPSVYMSLVFDTTPTQEGVFGVLDAVKSFGGTLNGMVLAGSAGGWLWPPPPGGCPLASNALCGGPYPSLLSFTLANGDSGYIYWDDMVIGGMVLAAWDPNTTPYPTPYISDLLLWQADVVNPPVSTPEPNSGLLLSAAIPFGLLLRKR